MLPRRRDSFACVFLRIVEPPHDDLALCSLAYVFRLLLDGVREQRQARCLFYRIDCSNHQYAVAYSSHWDVLGTTKLSSLASSGIAALGRTNAPVEISGTSGVDGEDGFDVSTTLAKWVGTEMFGGEPITSCVYQQIRRRLQLILM